MKRIVKKFMLVIMMIALCFVAAMTASAENYTGECGLYGDNLTWSLDTETGELVISGEGEMANYNPYYGDNAPWYIYREHISTVSIKESVSNIGTYSFYSCKKIENVKIPKSVTTIENCAFYVCSGLRTLTIPNNVTSIGGMAFSGCGNLVSITLPIGITSLEGWLFSGCSSLEEIIIPENVTSIKSEVFRGCENLKSIEIPEGVTTIEFNAFWGCSSLESVTIPSTVKSISTSPFYGCANIKNINVAKENKNFCTDEYGALYNTSKTMLYRFPVSEYAYYKIDENVKQICSSAFLQCNDLKNVIIPEGVTQIGEGAFSQCENLENVVIPEGVTQIGEGAFSQCENLKNAIIPDSVLNIKRNSFYGCSSLSKVTIGSGVQQIYGNAFYNCVALEEVIIPSSVESIGEFAFQNCKNIKEITFSEGLKTIARDAFSGCINIEKVIFPDSLLSVDIGAFENCTNLKMLTIPNSVTDISNSAFSFCRNLENVIIGNSVKSIGAGAFRACGIKHVGYIGTEIQWSTVSIGEGNEYLTDAPYFHYEFNPETDITEVVTTSTCQNEGVKSIVCSCGYTYSSEKLPLDDCSFTTYNEDGNATCIDDGTKTSYCDYGCGASDTVTDEGSALGHNMVCYEVVKEVTCTVSGEARVSCARCDYFEMKEIIANDHTDENHDGYCDYCNEFIADENCICICHAKGIGAFIYKLFRIIDRILNTKLVLKVFGISDICACGIAHY